MENLQFVIPLIKTYGYPVIAIGILLECMGVPFPGETVLILGAVSAAQGHMSIAAVILLAAAAAIMGDNFGYWIGRKLGRNFIFTRLEKMRLLKPHHIKRAENAFLRYGSATIFIGRFTAILRTYSALLAGIFEVPYPVFLGFNVAGGIAWATVMGLLGFTLGKNLSLLNSIIVNIQLVVLVSLAFFILWVVGRKAYRILGRGKAVASASVVQPDMADTSLELVRGVVKTSVANLFATGT